jgi:hypothetical protein
VGDAFPRILSAKAADPAACLRRERRGRQADTAALEREIDERVYELYGLTEEEIEIVEGATDGTRREKRFHASQRFVMSDVSSVSVPTKPMSLLRLQDGRVGGLL